MFKTVSDRVGDFFLQARVESFNFFKHFIQHFVGARRSQLDVSVVGCTFIATQPVTERVCSVCTFSPPHKHMRTSTHVVLIHC